MIEQLLDEPCHMLLVQPRYEAVIATGEGHVHFR